MTDTPSDTPASAARARWTWAPIAIVLAFATAVEIGIDLEAARDLDVTRERFRVDSHDEAVGARDRVAHAFRSLYEGLRTIARLPGVRELGNAPIAEAPALEFHGGAGLADDSRRTIQEIYNNLATNVDLSEVYVVPLDLDPDAPGVGHAEPLVTFDELLLGESSGDDEHSEELEEIEIHEYRVMRDQLAWFRAHVPSERELHALEYPALCGPEVVTCDNRRFDPRAPDDRDRAGLVYSVPFYRPDGALAGCVSGVVLTHALRDLLTTDRAVIVHAATGYAATPHTRGLWNAHEASWRAARPASELVYSESLPIPVRDESGAWALWCGAPDAEFWASPAAEASFATARSARLVLWTLALVIAAAWITARRRQAQLRAANAELEQRVRERTAELLDATRLGATAEIAARILHNVGNVLNSANVSVRLLMEQQRDSKAASLARVAALLREHQSDLARYLASDERGRVVPQYLTSLAEQLTHDEKRVATELGTVARSLAHAIEILEEQRDIASAHCLLEDMPVTKLAEAALAVVAGSAAKRGFTLEREFECLDEVRIDRSRAMQIVVNLLTNAMDACAENPGGGGHIVVRTRATDAGVVLEVQDSGSGITPENMARIFSGKFTTKKHGHGIGLRYSATAAGEFGGKLEATSAGTGRGATFHLSLPRAAGELAQAA